MAKCPLARHIVLTTEGSLTYTTPLTVEKMKEKHAEFLVNVREALGEAITREVSFVEAASEKLCITAHAGKRCFIVCGHPDAVYLLYGESVKHPLMLVIEATLSPSVKHIIRGELLFYTLATYLSYGAKTYGLVATPRHIYLIAYRAYATLLLRRLLGLPIYEKALESAERLRSKKPWICSLCDLKHVCPLGAEL